MNFPAVEIDLAQDVETFHNKNDFVVPKRFFLQQKRFCCS